VVTRYRLKELLYYHPESGDFIRLEKTGNQVRAGTQAGCINGHGYIDIRIDGRVYKAHRLAFLYMTGEFPPNDADHRNTVKHDNCWGNLRPATDGQNKYNQGLRVDNSTGFKLIGWNKISGTFRVQSRINGVLRHFGYYKKLDDAIEAAAQVMLTFHSDFARAA